MRSDIDVLDRVPRRVPDLALEDSAGSRIICEVRANLPRHAGKAVESAPVWHCDGVEVVLHPAFKRSVPWLI